MALNDCVVALWMLLGTLVIPFAVFLQMLRLNPRAIRLTAQPTARENRR